MKKSVFTFGLLASSLIMLLVMPFLNNNNNSFLSNTTAMAQEYDKYGDSSYSKYPTDDKKYECRTGPFEGFFVSSVEFCKHVKFDDDKDRKDHNRESGTGPQGPSGPGNNNSTLVNTFNCINTNNINIDTDNNSSSSSSSGLQPIQDAIVQGLNGTLDGLSLNKTIINLCIIYDNDSIVIEGAGNVTDGNGDVPETCEECFERFLTEAQITLLLGSATLEGYCDAVELGNLNEAEVREDLATANVSAANIDALIECLQNLAILPI
jgi:hypothetical protein